MSTFPCRTTSIKSWIVISILVHMFQPRPHFELPLINHSNQDTVNMLQHLICRHPLLLQTLLESKVLWVPFSITLEPSTQHSSPLWTPLLPLKHRPPNWPNNTVTNSWIIVPLIRMFSYAPCQCHDLRYWLRCCLSCHSQSSESHRGLLSVKLRSSLSTTHQWPHPDWVQNSSTCCCFLRRGQDCRTLS